jgi:hypothetical protein
MNPPPLPLHGRVAAITSPVSTTLLNAWPEARRREALRAGGLLQPAETKAGVISRFR